LKTTPPLTLADYDARAQEILPRGIYDYFARGAADDITLRENETAWNQLRLRPRVLVDVAAPDLTTTILGQAVTMPVLTAPCALNAMAHPDGELAVARATAGAGVIQVLSVGSSYTLEEVAAAAAGPRWFQLYCVRDPAVTRDLVERAEAAGYGALCLTVDSPTDGIREHNARNRFKAPPPGHRPLANLASYDFDFSEKFRNQSWHDPSLTWATLAWLRGITRLPIVVKGVLDAEDGRLAAEHGAAGIIVSNHGGRQLDTCLATCPALRPIVEAVAGKAEVYVDGGIRRGSDVLKALALGARAVLIGRSYLWGLAVDGEAGVARVLEILRHELRMNLALSGTARVGQAGLGLIQRPTERGRACEDADPKPT
jgi:4-hydroxymandelate oxidase